MGFDAGYGIGSVKPGVCTSSTRPASPFDGQVIYETDTNVVSVYDGAAWATVGPAVSGGVVALTSNATQTITSGILVGLNTTYTFEAGRTYKISTANGWSITGDILLAIGVGGVTVQRYFDSRFATRNSTFLNVSGFWVGSVAAGSKTVDISVVTLSGVTYNTGTATGPNQLIIEDIGTA